jgi:flavin-dependent dehydrogenase
VTRPASPPDRVDVLVIGGAFSGAASALLLRRWLPGRRVMVVERAEEFDRKVGEATVELSALFLHRVLGLSDFLARHQLPKHGLRFWFASDPDQSLAEMTEVGPAEVPRLPSFLLDRAVLDEHMLSTARAEGAEVLRPARVTAMELGRPESRVEIEIEGGEHRTVSARWVIDASGRHAFLARRLRLHHRVEEHPTAALWGRWSGVADLDGAAFLGTDLRSPRLPPVAPVRRLATNHFCGDGWWCWFIALKSGQTSVGLVYNKELIELPGETPEERYRRFLASRPGIRELLADASLEEGDLRAYGHLPYRSERYAGSGWALVGDAASFMDPYYSPGLDHAGISVFATVRMIEGDLSGRLDEAALESAVERHNQVFDRSYGKWLEALYLGKYELMGDAELLTAAYLVETALYYLGIVTTKYRDLEHLRYPPYGEGIWQETLVFRIMRGFTRRLRTLARRRRELGLYGRRNSGWRLLGRAPGLGRHALPMLAAGLRVYLRVERETFAARLGSLGRRAVPAPKAAS